MTSARRKGNPAASDTTESRRRHFRAADAARAAREWGRYEGTPQRDLFVQLRTRFLARHPPPREGPTLDLGAGPGRFVAALRAHSRPLVLADLSRAMLEFARAASQKQGGELPELVVADGESLPFLTGVFTRVVALGNVIGFAAARSDRILAELRRSRAPGGVVVLELSAGSGERSRYLQGLPGGALRRVLRAPAEAVEKLVERDGFVLEEGRPRGNAAPFRRFKPADVERLSTTLGGAILEVMAVAPCVGQAPDRILGLGTDPAAWEHLLDLEERIGRQPARWTEAAALLVALGSEPPGRLRGGSATVLEEV